MMPVVEVKCAERDHRLQLHPPFHASPENLVDMARLFSPPGPASPGPPPQVFIPIWACSSIRPKFMPSRRTERGVTAQFKRLFRFHSFSRFYPLALVSSS